MSTLKINPVIANRLGSLRRGMMRWIFADTLSKVLLVVLGYVIFTAGTDWYFRFDQAQRAGLMVLCLAGIGFVIYRWLMKPLAQQIADEQLILRVEDRHPELGESVISAVYFSNVENPAEHGASPELMQTAIKSGFEKAGTVNFADIVDAPGRNRRLGISGGITGSLLLTTILMYFLAPQPLQIWANRNLMIGSMEWPKQTTLIIDGLRDGKLVVPRGDDWSPTIKVEGVEPTVIQLDYVPEDGRGRVTETLRKVEDRWTTTFKNVRQPFEFRVRGGDDRTQWIQAELVDRPSVEQITLTVTPPAYTGLSRYQTDARQKTEAVYPGSEVEIEAYSNKALDWANLALGGESIGSMKLEGTQTITLANEDGSQRQVELYKMTASLPASKLKSGAYEISLMGSEGLKSKRPERFSLRLQRDRSPIVRAEMESISGMAVPGASIPVRMTVSDDFALNEVGLRYVVRSALTPAGDGDTADNQEQGELTLRRQGDQWIVAQSFPAGLLDAGRELEDGPVMEEGPAMEDVEPEPVPAVAPVVPEGPAYVPVTIASASRLEGKKEVTLEYVLELSALNLKENDSVQFHIYALDNDDINGPNEGKSSDFYLRIVSVEVLQEELSRREGEQRRELERLYADQARLETTVASIRATYQAVNKQPLPAEDKSQLKNTEKLQRLAAGRCKSIANQLELILREMVNNDLPDELGDRDRLSKGIIGPLLILSEGTEEFTGSIPKAANMIEYIQTANLSFDDRMQVFNDTSAQQNFILQKMAGVLELMAKRAELEAIVRLISATAKTQEELNERTRKAIQDYKDSVLKDIFD